MLHLSRYSGTKVAGHVGVHVAEAVESSQCQVKKKATDNGEDPSQVVGLHSVRETHGDVSVEELSLKRHLKIKQVLFFCHDIQKIYITHSILRYVMSVILFLFSIIQNSKYR